MGAQSDTSTSAPEVWHGVQQILAPLFVPRLLATYLDLLTGSSLIHAEELLALTTEQKFPHWRGWALAHRGLALAAGGQAEEAFALLTQALEHLRAIGVVQGLTGPLVWLAKSSTMLGQS